MRRGVLSLAAAVIVLSLAPAAPAAAAPMPLLSNCTARTDTADSFSYRFCSGFVPSFDGVPLDVDLTLPAGSTPREGYPLIVMMHGWGNSKTDWESGDFCDSSSADKCHYNNLSFAHLGYAVLNYTARGFHGSCGPDSPNAASPACATGWTHLSDMRWEIHDTQYVAGLLVDAGVARPRIAVTGGSYGGGQSWLLAVLANRVMSPDGTLHRWTSPAGTPMSVAVAVPKYPWTDLVDSLLPNGRAADGVIQADGDRTAPFGIDKESYVDYLYSSGASSARYAAPGQDPTADLTTWYSEINAGETPAESTYAPPIITQTTKYRSAYYQDALIRADAAARTETPTLDIQGWTDALFPEVEGASMIEKIRAADAAWPAYLYASDLGHPPANNGKFSEWKVINKAATDFIDLYMKVGKGAAPASIYQEQLVTCDANAGAVLAGSSPGAIARGQAKFVSSEAGHATASAATDAAAGTATDPLVFYAGNGGKGGCITLPGALPANGAMTSWSFPVCAQMTLAGEPVLNVAATIAGTDAEVNSRLWDVAPDGTMTLVARGMYRWTGAPGAASISYALLGNGWVFAAGHRLRLEVTQNDAPYMRLDNYASAITYASIGLTLPVTSVPGC